MSTTGRADAFYRGGSNATPLEDRPVYDVSFPCLTEAEARDLPALVRKAEEAKGSRGSFLTGVFEIQTDWGIWSRADKMRLDTDTPRKAAKAYFATWDEMERTDKLASELAPV
jgi:hypothetical protein